MGRVVAAVILAGGKSVRMGVDKAGVRVGGVMMLERVVRAAREVCGRVVVVGREVLPAGWDAGLEVELLADEEGGKGPLGGVVAGLRRVGGDVLVLSCDVPLVTGGFLRELVGAHEAGGEGRVGTLAERVGEGGEVGVEPTVGVYGGGLLGELEGRLAAGRLALGGVRGVAGVAVWRVPGEWEGVVLNVNSVAEVGEAEVRIMAKFE